MDHAETAPGEHRIVTGYTSAETTHKRVLVVDNNPFHRELLRNTLEPLGFIVYEAMDGTEVLAACKQIKPDIVLMDLQMSGIDGVTVTKQLKQQPDCSKIPVIALSTSPIADELAKQGKEKDDFAGYVNKPFSTILLLELIATQLSISLNYAEEQALETKSEKFVCPPVEDLEELLTLVSNGNITGIFQKIESLAAEDSGNYGAFSTKLAQLAENFQLSRVTRFIESCLSRETHKNSVIKEVSHSSGPDCIIPQILFKR